MKEKIRFYLNRLKERLWVRPLFMCLLSITGIFLAKAADNYLSEEMVPAVSPDSLSTLLGILSSGMLVIAVFAVGAMISAYNWASTSATPRSFPLIVADGVSQNALSVFIGAFIYSVLSQIALDNDYYDVPGHFALLILTLTVFAIVIMTFVRWVDRIARLGNMATTMEKVEAAARNAFAQRMKMPALGGKPVTTAGSQGQVFFSATVGYVKRIDMAALQSLAEESDVQIQVAALPGAFVTPIHPIAFVDMRMDRVAGFDQKALSDAFLIGNNRSFDDDPRFGLVTLSEIASRALSPAVNDPGTAISVIGTLVRILEPLTRDNEVCPVQYDRVTVPVLSMEDIFDDAFSATARDGAGLIEVVVHLQNALNALAAMGSATLHDAAVAQATQTLARAEQALQLPEDLMRARQSSEFCKVRSGKFSQNSKGVWGGKGEPDKL